MLMIKEKVIAWYAQPKVHHGDFKATLAESFASDVRPTLHKRVYKILFRTSEAQQIVIKHVIIKSFY